VTSHAASDVALPDPLITPLVTVEGAGKLLGLGRHAAYNAARLKQIPTIRLGRKLMVPVAGLWKLLGMDPKTTSPEEDTPQLPTPK
jgi:hypothetical protein